MAVGAAASCASRSSAATCRREARSRGPSRSASGGRSRAGRRRGRGTGRSSPRRASPARSASARAPPGRRRACRRACRRSRPPRRPRASRRGRAARARPRAGSRETASRSGRARCSASDEVARVRVDPPLARLPDRRRRVPREPGRVREQVPDGGALGPGRLVQVERPLLGGDQRRVRRRASLVTEPQPRRWSTSPCAARTHRPVATPAAACSAGHASIWRSASTGGDTSRVERRLIPGHSPYEPVVGYSRAVVSGAQRARLRDGADPA